MKGIIFNLLEEVVTAQFGETAWDETLVSAGVDGAYTSLGNYPDQQLIELLADISRRAGKSDRETLKWFGRASMPYLYKHYPDIFTAHHSLRSFLLSLNDVIHAEVRKLYPGADVPVFEFESPAGEGALEPLIIRYRSKRRLCFLAEGFIGGAADCYKQEVTVSQQQCMLEGAADCVLLCSFTKPA